jgi:ribosome biogenesis GTPase
MIGPSGVGKSTLINQIFPDADLRTQILSEATGRGQHTTTTSTMHFSPLGFSLIDTPGIRDFGLLQLLPEDVRDNFPGFQQYVHQCRFRDCKHHLEPDCAIIEACKSGALAQSRHSIYQKIYAEAEQLSKQWSIKGTHDKRSKSS